VRQRKVNPNNPSLWVMVSRDGGGWACVVCNVDPAPNTIVVDGGSGFGAMTALLACDIRGSFLDAGDGKGPRRWGCDIGTFLPNVLEPGMNEIELLPVDGPAGKEWQGGGWIGTLVPMEEIP
jgi:hypothetical protein